MSGSRSRTSIEFSSNKNNEDRKQQALQRLNEYKAIFSPPLLTSSKEITKSQILLPEEPLRSLDSTGRDLISIIKSKLGHLDSIGYQDLELEYFTELFHDDDNIINNNFKIRTIQILISLLELRLAVSTSTSLVLRTMLESCAHYSQELLQSHQLEIHKKYAPRFDDVHERETQSLINAINATAEVISRPSQSSLHVIGGAIEGLNRLKLDSNKDKIFFGIVGVLLLAAGIAGSMFLSPFVGILAGVGIYLLYQANKARKQEAGHAKRYNCFRLFKDERLQGLEGSISEDKRANRDVPIPPSFTPTNRS